MLHVHSLWNILGRFRLLSHITCLRLRYVTTLCGIRYVYGETRVEVNEVLLQQKSFLFFFVLKKSKILFLGI